MTSSCFKEKWSPQASQRKSVSLQQNKVCYVTFLRFARLLWQFLNDQLWNHQERGHWLVSLDIIAGSPGAGRGAFSYFFMASEVISNCVMANSWQLITINGNQQARAKWRPRRLVSSVYIYDHVIYHAYTMSGNRKIGINIQKFLGKKIRENKKFLGLTPVDPSPM